MSEKLTRPPTYFAAFAVLIAITLLTVGVSFLELGSWHTLVGVGFGIAKALLVALFFMHLLGSPRLTWLVVSAALFWFGIMLVLTLSDYLTRHWLVF
jgi:cytochrome c oxidase subunit 4